MIRPLLLLLLTAPGWTIPWGAAGVPPARMRPMPQMRVLNADHPGESFDLKAHLTEGRFNVVDFFAEW